MRPTTLHVGGTLYWVIRTYTPGTSVLVDADSTPSIAVRKNGASVGDSVTITKRSATTGIYDCSYNPAGEVEGDKFTLEETAVISSTTYSQNFEVLVTAVERGTDSALTDKTGYSLSSTGLDAVLAESGIAAGAGLTNDTGTQLTSINLRQAISACLSALAGVISGASSNAPAFKQAGKPAGNTRISSTTTTDGRTAVNLKVPD